jgi:hypothetical protein
MDTVSRLNSTCSTNPILPTNTIADRIAFVHAALPSPVLPAWCAAKPTA